LKPYGKLKQNEVYIRRGSSTAIARPDEIATMRDSQLTNSQKRQPVRAHMAGTVTTKKLAAIQQLLLDPQLSDIMIDPGTYNGTLEINRAINIDSSGVNNTVIEGNNDIAVLISSDNVTIRNLTITNGIMITGKNVRIENCTIKNSKDNISLINIEGGLDVYICNCDIFNSATTGIWITGNSTAIIENCNIYNTVDSGIDIDGDNICCINKCLVYGCEKDSIKLRGGNIEIVNSTIRSKNKNTILITAEDVRKLVVDNCRLADTNKSGIILLGCTKAKVSNESEVVNCEGYGILLSGLECSLELDNTIIAYNGVGISIAERAGGVSIVNSKIYSNKIGIESYKLYEPHVKDIQMIQNNEINIVEYYFMDIIDTELFTQHLANKRNRIIRRLESYLPTSISCEIDKYINGTKRLESVKKDIIETLNEMIRCKDLYKDGRELFFAVTNSRRGVPKEPEMLMMNKIFLMLCFQKSIN
jgi:hypothetical protein